MDWPSPPGSPCAPIPPGMVAPFSLSFPHLPIHSSAVAPLSRSPLCFAHPSTDPDACSASLAPLQSRCAALLRSPLCFPSLTAQCSALQPPPSPSRSSGRWQNRAGDGSIKQANNRTDKKTVESSGPTSKSMRRRRKQGGQHVHKAIRRRLTPKASQEHPDA
jgi:hypothetical protein